MTSDVRDGGRPAAALTCVGGYASILRDCRAEPRISATANLELIPYLVGAARQAVVTLDMHMMRSAQSDMNMNSR